MTDLPHWLRIPETFRTSGDPCEENPFDPSDQRHGVWRDATRRAEEEVARINVRWMGGLTVDNAEDWAPSLWAARFSVWAERGIHVVWSDRDVAIFDDWLLRYANSSLSALAEFFEKCPPPPTYRDQVLLKTRNLLAREVQRWKAEGRRYVAEQKAFQASQVNSAPRPVSPATVSRRRALVTAYRRDRGISAEQFARALNCDPSALRAVVREDNDKSSPDLRARLLQRLGVSQAEWYRED